MELDGNIDEIQLTKTKRAWFSIKIMPWFMGLTTDLIFYIAINTLFLTVVKDLTASQISFLTTISSLCYIILQRPFLKIINKMGNAKSVRSGAVLLLLGNVIITFAKSYYVMMIGQVLYTVSFIFKSMDSIMLKNNLTYLDRKDDYIKYKNKASIIYSIVTTIIALFAGYIFNINYYLPMYLNIFICLINVLISFTLTDENEEISREYMLGNRNKKIKFSTIILLIMFSYGIFYATISTGQTNIKLFVQYELENYFEIGLTATYFSYIFLMSRIFRVVANISFSKIYIKVRDKIGYYLVLLAGFAFLLVIASSYISQIATKFILMSVGFCMILGIRDMFDTYIQDLLLKQAAPEQQQASISYLGMARRIGETSISLIFSLMLLRVDMFYIIVSLLALSLISFVINNMLYKQIRIKDIK